MGDVSTPTVAVDLTTSTDSSATAPPDGGLRDSVGQLPSLPATPEEFNNDMREAQIAEFGDPDGWQMNTRTGPEPSPVCAFPSLYFLGYVTVSLPQGGFRQEAPRYCGTGYAAAVMLSFTQKYFDADASMYYDWPQDDEYGGGYSSNRKVPWLKSGSKKANVGLMSEYFTHNYPSGKAMVAALAEFR